MKKVVNRGGLGVRKWDGVLCCWNVGLELIEGIKKKSFMRDGQDTRVIF